VKRERKFQGAKAEKKPGRWKKSLQEHERPALALGKK